MSVTRVTRINLSGDQQASDMTFQHVYEVEVSVNTDTQAVVLGAPGLPVMGQQHPNFPQAVVTSRRARLREERRWKLWIVDIAYSIVVGNEDAITRDPTQAPDLRIPELRIRTAQKSVVRTEDLDNKPLMNTAREMFPQGERTFDAYYAIVSYRRWYRSVDLDPLGAVLAYSGKFNSSAWKGVSAGGAQIQSVSTEREFWQNQLFFRTDFEIAVNGESQYAYIPNVGMHVLTGINLDNQIGRKPIMLKDTDDNGNPNGIRFRASEPVPISQNGRSQLADGQDPIILQFRMYSSIDFNSIGLI